MKTIIAGGRNFTPNGGHMAWILPLFITLPITEVISGGAKGADAFGEWLANEKSIPLKIFRAEWKIYGAFAGPKRNKEMAAYADACILFPGGNGTADMKARAIAAGLKIIEWSVE